MIIYVCVGVFDPIGIIWVILGHLWHDADRDLWPGLGASVPLHMKSWIPTLVRLNFAAKVCLRSHSDVHLWSYGLVNIC